MCRNDGIVSMMLLHDFAGPLVIKEQVVHERLAGTAKDGGGGMTAII